MSSSELVSLLVPTHNNAATVAETLRSCLDQTYKPIEILVYDEASTDGTREIVREMARQDVRIQFFSSDENSGPLLAWRKLLHRASGRWCTFAWSDDLLLPAYVETLAAVLKSNPTDLITGCGAYVEKMPSPAESALSLSRGKLYDFKSARLKAEIYALGILAAIYPASQICSLFQTAAAREVFDHYINFPNPYGFDFSRKAYGNDISFLSELALRSGEVMMVGEPLVVLRESQSSMTWNALRDHRWQFRLQYVWAIRHAWRLCQDLSPRMQSLIQVVDDRVSLCDTMYSFSKKKWPREFSLTKILRAIWFLMNDDRRFNKSVTSETLECWLQNRTK